MEFSKGKDLYLVLGCDELSNKDQICTEFRHKVKDVHPDKKPGDKEALEKYQELKVAYDILSNEEKRKKYDQWRRSGLVVPFDVWISLKASHAGQHWALKPAKEKMLCAEPHSGEEGMPSCDDDAGHLSVIHSSNTKSQDLTLPRKRECANETKFRFADCTSGGALSKFRKYEV